MNDMDTTPGLRVSVRLRALLVGSLAVLVAAFFGYHYRAAAHDALDRLKLLPQPERFTELYLDDYTALAKSLPPKVAGGAHIRFAFTVHNLEGRAMAYPYTVYIVEPEGTTTIGGGTLYLADGAATTTVVERTFQGASTQATVYVELPEEQESLHFFVPNRG